MKRLLAAVVLTSVLTACSDGQTKNELDDALGSGACASWTQSAPPIDEEAATSAIGGLFDTAGSLEPDRWMRDPSIRLVVVGRVQDFIEGPSVRLTMNQEEEIGRVPARTLVMRVRVTHVAKGKADASGLVHVYLGSVNRAEAANSAIATGTVVALYLEQFANRPEYRSTIEMPDDAILWGVSPLGFVAANGPDGGVVLPYLGEVSPTKTFESQLPSSIRNRPRC